MAIDADGTLGDGDPTRLDIGVRPQPAPSTAKLSGRRVSHFRIGAPLGNGGMGIVYEAEDTRLGRSVALKFLTPEMIQNPTAKTRFLTEARAASALDHPNLCTILEIGESEDGLLFLAMPRYEGESLDRLIARGPLPLDQALDVAIQAARGLAKAHQNGIVHRDVKPENLFVTPDGVVKILDFGIAKLLGEAGPTQLGFSLGTPSYMSPEQTRGQEVDARADVWSLGVVLYEALTGKRPFVGGTGDAVVHAVLHKDPEPLSRLRPEVPAELERIVSRMLARDPAQRYADTSEVLADLRRILGLTSTGSLTFSSPDQRPQKPVRPIFWVTALVVLGLAAALLLWRQSGTAPPPQPVHSVRLTDFQGTETSPSLSPDGTFVVYAKSADGHFDLFLQRVDGGNPINLTADSPADDVQPAFSPNSQQIVFRSEREGGGIFLMGATGESVKRLTDFGFNPAWSPDGREIAVATEETLDPRSRYSSSQIFRIDVITGARRSLDVPDGVQPSWSPHRLRIAFWGLAQPGARRVIRTIPVDGGAPVTVVDDAFYNWSPVWSPDGGYLYFASNRGGSMNLWRVAIDERSGQVLGDPQPVTTPSEWSALPSLSHDGSRLAFATNTSRSFVEQVSLDPQTGQVHGSPFLVYQTARGVRTCDISPDGDWLVLSASLPAEDLLLIRPDGNDLRQLTNDLDRDRTPRWSPDGREILFASNRSGKSEAWTIRPDGSRLTQVTKLPDSPVLYPFWSPDGRSIAFHYVDRGTGLLSLQGSYSPLRMLPPVGDGQTFAGFDWSEDGRFLAGQLLLQDQASVPGIVLWSRTDNTYRRLTPTGGDPVFARGGRHIFFVEEGTIRLVDVASGNVRTVLSPPLYSLYRSARVSRDGTSLCTVRDTAEGDIWSLSLVDPEGPS
ncbi:MAG TPA: protein kinase [Thermoanaerobaculia bacterium]|nr:protein kinase [Thermoanaerobaculia bacterium]